MGDTNLITMLAISGVLGVMFWVGFIRLIRRIVSKIDKMAPSPKHGEKATQIQHGQDTIDVEDDIHGITVTIENIENKSPLQLLYEEIKSLIIENGVAVYAWERQCYKCHKKTKIYSYYLIHDLEKYFAGDLGLEQCGEIGLGYIPSLDAFVAEQLPDTGIKLRYSRSEEMRYFANGCSHCDCLQGRNYIVDDPDEIFEDLYMEGDMEQYHVATLFVPGSVADDIADYIVTSLGT